MLLLLWCSGLGFESLDLEAIGFYRFNILSFHRMGEEYVVCSDLDDLICVVAADGTLLAKYGKAGKGPTELGKPFVLGTTDDRVVVITQDRHLLTFDRRLELQSPAYPPLHLMTWGGIRLEAGRFLIFTNRSRPQFGLTEVVLEANEWKIKTRTFPFFPDPETDIHHWTLNYQNGLAFRNMWRLWQADGYEVEVHDLREGFDPNVIQLLQAPLDGISKRDNTRLYLIKAFKNGNAYVAHLQLKDHPSYEANTAWLDRFGLDGRFLGREEIAAPTGLIQVHGGPEVLLLDYDSMVVRILPPIREE